MSCSKGPTKLAGSLLRLMELCEACPASGVPPCLQVWDDRTSVSGPAGMINTGALPSHALHVQQLLQVQT